MTHQVPRGFRVSGVAAGIKRYAEREDVTLVVSDHPCTAAGVYTTNRVFAAPVALDRARTPSDQMRAVVVNSGNANACTGEQGDRDALEMTRLTAQACNVPAESVLVMSTGIIGHHLPMEKVAAGISKAAAQLGATPEHLMAAQRGIMTTDTREKMASRTLELAGRTITITGLAKGAGMIGPKMATLLSIVMTDARLAAAEAQQVLGRVAEASFNSISVEGHMSTNDTLLLLASGAAGTEPLQGEQLARFERALLEVCTDLARAIADDGEGATHLVEIEVVGAADDQGARRIAKTIADSPLVKCAIAGNDPNWGRIVSAAGYSGVEFDLSATQLIVNGFCLFRAGSPVSFDAAAVSGSMRDHRETKIQLQVGSGLGHARFWTCDLTTEYVHINADYHT
ncbi:MAG: bifunctional glutamate N-acetyltransferase/amino-acid acetyltransferase ArgJ [Pirellulales bacterium]